LEKKQAMGPNAGLWWSSPWAQDAGWHRLQAGEVEPAAGWVGEREERVRRWRVDFWCNNAAG